MGRNLILRPAKSIPKIGCENIFLFLEKTERDYFYLIKWPLFVRRKIIQSSLNFWFRGLLRFQVFFVFLFYFLLSLFLYEVLVCPPPSEKGKSSCNTDAWKRKIREVRVSYQTNTQNRQRKENPIKEKFPTSITLFSLHFM